MLTRRLNTLTSSPQTNHHFLTEAKESSSRVTILDWGIVERVVAVLIVACLIVLTIATLIVSVVDGYFLKVAIAMTLAVLDLLWIDWLIDVWKNK